MAATSKAISREEIEEIIERVAGGMTLMQSCKKAKKDYININKRINADTELKQFYARTRDEYARTGAQKMHDIACDKTIDPATRRMMIDVLKWEIARILPKEFGDRVQQEVIIQDNRTLSTRMQQARSRARRDVQTAESVAVSGDPRNLLPQEPDESGES